MSKCGINERVGNPQSGAKAMYAYLDHPIFDSVVLLSLTYVIPFELLVNNKKKLNGNTNWLDNNLISSAMN